MTVSARLTSLPSAVVVSLVATAVMGAPLVPWLVDRSTSSESFTGLVLTAAGVVMWLTSTPDDTPLGRAAGRGPLWVALALTTATLLAAIIVDVRVLQAMALVGVAWSALALVDPARAWPTLPAALLMVLGQPLSGDLDVIGFPLRLLSAKVAALVLPAFGVAVTASETVLVTEGNVADVEAPCAGLSTLRYVLATTLMLAWRAQATVMSTVAATVGAVLTATLGNATRVTILCAMVLGAGRADLAALLHVPLGVLSFLAAAVCATVLLVPRRALVAPSSSQPAASSAPVAVTVAVVVVAALVTGARVGRASLLPPRPPSVTLTPSSLAPLTSTWQVVPLSPGEERLWRDHADAAVKRRLAAPATGEAVYVLASSMRATHAPERCLSAIGHRVDVSGTLVIDGVTFKRLVLNGGAHTGLSVLVSQTATASSLSERVALELSGHGRRWVFASAVFASVGAVDRSAVDLSERERDVARALIGDARDILSLSMQESP